MNLPNKLSILRIVLVPVTLLFMLPISIFGWEPQGWNNFINSNGMIVAAGVFILASLTDCADGKIARKYNLITDLGKFLDSLVIPFVALVSHSIANHIWIGQCF